MATTRNLIKFIEAALSIEGVLRRYGLRGNTGQNLKLLILIGSDTAVVQKFLVERTGLPKDVVSKALNNLAERGFITIVKDSVDRRINVLRITSRGAEVVQRVSEILTGSRPLQKKSQPEFLGVLI